MQISVQSVLWYFSSNQHVSNRSVLATLLCVKNSKGVSIFQVPFVSAPKMTYQNIHLKPIDFSTKTIWTQTFEESRTKIVHVDWLFVSMYSSCGLERFYSFNRIFDYIFWFNFSILLAVLFFLLWICIFKIY